MDNETARHTDDGVQQSRKDHIEQLGDVAQHSRSEDKPHRVVQVQVHTAVVVVWQVVPVVPPSWAVVEGAAHEH